jgi:uncharacterized protein (TIGR02172 family)
MNISLSKPIARGRTADVYAWDDRRILKLYQAWCPPHWVEQESRVAQLVCQVGIPTPAAGEIVSVDGRRGILYERVNGISMLEDLRRRPWLILRHAQTLAELHAQIHRQTIPNLYSYRDGLARSIQQAPQLTEAARQKALARLADLPDEQKLCHGDFHPQNILVSAQGVVVIDWMTASLGNPLADVARTSLILSVGVRSAGREISSLARLFSGLFHRTYLNRYLALTPGGQVELLRWQPVIAAARLNECIEPEREALLEIVQDGFE